MEQKIRKVIIGTPSYDGKIDANYVDALHRTSLIAYSEGIYVFPLFICYDALVQRARNDIFKIAIESDVEDLIFIDGDEAWEPNDFIKLLSHDVDVVGGTARKKTDLEQYVVKIIEGNGLKREENGLIKVEGIGTGFTRLSRRAMQAVWDQSEEYEGDNGIKNRMVFDISIKEGKLISEDISLCHKLTKAGITIWFDPTITCDHIGIKNYKGNFLEWEKSL